MKSINEKAEEAKRLYETANADQRYVLERLFPDLKESEESENERIRKEIISIFKGEAGYTSKEDTDRYIAWIEKQGEQKLDTDFSDLRTWKYIVDAVWTKKEGIGQYLDSPFTEEVAKKLQKRFGNIKQNHAWSEEDKKNLEKTIWYVEKGSKLIFEKTDKLVSWLKSLKDRVQPQPKQEWSEEDENRFRNLIYLVGHSDEGKATKEGFVKFINRLKSLRPQNTWKPSEEQIIALRWVLNNVPYNKHKEEISGLLDQIKKL